MANYEHLYIGVRDKRGIEIREGDKIRDAFGNEGVVWRNMHPWGFERLQYDGFSITHTAPPEHYEIIDG